MISKDTNTIVVGLPNDTIIDYLTPRKNGATLAAGLGFFQHFKAAKTIYADLGVRAYLLSFAPHFAGGQYSAFLTNVAGYHFRLNSKLVQAEVHWFITEWLWKPTFVLGVGTAWNTISHVEQASINWQPGVTPLNFTLRNRQMTNFTCTLAAGMTRFNGIMPTFGLMYHYQYLGDGTMNVTSPSGQFTPKQVNIGVFNVHTIILTFYI